MYRNYAHKYIHSIMFVYMYMCIYILYLFIFLMKNKVNQIYICIFHGLSSNSMYSTLLTKVPNFVKFSQNLNLLHNFSIPACALLIWPMMGEVNLVLSPPKSQQWKHIWIWALALTRVSPVTVNVLVQLAEAYFSCSYARDLFQGMKS